MSFEALLVQLLTGLAGASTLFLVAVGLSLIFGVTRIVNFAHGSFYMLGLYLACSVAAALGPKTGFWWAVLLAPLAVALLGALVEMLVLRRIYQAPELFQLLATFALVLVMGDATLWLWGAEDRFGPRAPGLEGAIDVLGRRFPVYDLFLIAIGPLILLALWLLLHRTRWGRLVRAATQDREMVGALGVQQAWLFTSVFAVGAWLAGLGGALQMPREPANLGLDLGIIGDAFVVVVVGGMGSLPGAFVAALLIGEAKALCYGLGTVDWFGTPLALSKLTLVVEFLIMAVVLVLRPWGLLGRAPSVVRVAVTHAPAPLRPLALAARAAVATGLLVLLAQPWLLPEMPFVLVLGIDMLTAVLFAASLHLFMGPGGLHSFGHAAYFGVGAYAAALLARDAGLPFGAVLPLAALCGALAAALCAAFAVRLAGVYLAMLTLAFAQIVWSITYQWDGFTGGSNGLTGIWPPEALSGHGAYYVLTLGVVVVAVLALRHVVFSPFGLALRAARDSVARAEVSGIPVRAVQWLALVLGGLAAGLAGALFAFSKGSIAPDVMGVTRSVDALVMVLLGGVQSLSGPLAGAVLYTGLQDAVARGTEYWRAWLGLAILLLVALAPQGLAGLAQAGWQRLRQQWQTLQPQRGGHA